MKPLPVENIKGSWTIPTLGVMANFPITKLPPEALYRADNVLWRRGYLRCRPGMKLFASTVMTGVATGGYAVAQLGSAAFQADTFQNDAFQVLVPPFSSLFYIGTTRKLYIHLSGTLADVTGSALTANAGNIARFTSIFYSSNVYVLHTNGVDAPQVSINAGVFAALAGSPPTFTDWCNIGQHIIGLSGPFTLRWSNNEDVNAAGSWPGANFMNVSETPDPKVAIRNLGTQGGALYGSNSIFNIVAQGGAESTFFRRELKYLVDGPANPAAVVDADGAHYYMSRFGRIGRFDGVTHAWVGDGAWPVIFQQDQNGNDMAPGLDTLNSPFIFGVYEPKYKEVWFFYPKVGDGGVCYGIVVVVLPRPQDGVNQHITFTGTLMGNQGVTAGTDLRFGENKVVLFTSQTPRVFSLDEGFQDNSVSITGSFQTGLVGGDSAGDEIYSLDAYEVLCQRGSQFGTLTMQPVFSYILDAEGATLGPSKNIDLTQTTVFDKQGVGAQGGDIQGRYFGLRASFTGPITLRWQGARLAASIQSASRDIRSMIHR